VPNFEKKNKSKIEIERKKNVGFHSPYWITVRIEKGYVQDGKRINADRVVGRFAWIR